MRAIQCEHRSGSDRDAENHQRDQRALSQHGLKRHTEAAGERRYVSRHGHLGSHAISNPELIVVGGELTAAGDLLRRAGETAQQTAWKNSRVRIVPSKFGSGSAAIGAALVYVKRR